MKFTLLLTGIWLAAIGAAADTTNAFHPTLDFRDDLFAGFERKMVYLPNVVATSNTPTLDGQVNEAVWQSGFRFDNFVEVESGKPAPENNATHGYILRAANGFYVAMVSNDSIPPARNGDGEVDPNDLNLTPDWTDGLSLQFNANPNDFTRYRFSIYRGGKRSAIRHYLTEKWEPEGWLAEYHATANQVSAEFYIPFSALTDRQLGAGSIVAFNAFKTAHSPRVVPGGPYRYRYTDGQYTWSSFFCHSIATADAFPWIYLGDELSYKALRRPPIARLYLDKSVYQHDDEAADGYLELRAASMPIAELSLTLRIVDKNGKVVHEQQHAKLNSPDIGFGFDPRQLPAGTYTVRSVIGHRGQPIADTERVFTMSNAPQKPTAKLPRHIPLVLTNEGSIGSGDRMVSTGIPFPKGALHDADLKQLYVERNERSHKDPKNPFLTHWVRVPLQTTVRNRWYKDGSIRWLGVDFPARYHLGHATTHRLVLGGEHIELASPLVTHETDDDITIVTGPMKAVVSKRAFRLLSAAWLDRNRDSQFDPDEQLIHAGPGLGLSRSDPDERSYHAAHADTRVWVDESGPLKTTIVAEGWYVHEGRRQGRHQTRMFFHRGSASVRIHHSYIITVNTREEAIRNVSLSVGLPDVARYEFGGSGRASITGDLGRRPVYLLQKRANEFVVEEERRGRQVGTELATGGKAAGWMAAHTKRGQVMLSSRRFWQLYPKELELSRRRMAFHVWPRHGREVFSDAEITDRLNIPKALFAHHGKLLKLKCPDRCFEEMGRTYTEAFQQRGITDPMPAWTLGGAYMFNYAIDAWQANGQGMAMSSELNLTLLPPAATTAEKQKIAASFQADPHALADPKWTHQTQVLGELWPEDNQRFGALERHIYDRHRYTFTDLTERLGDYGFVNWPDYHQYPRSFIVGDFEPTWFHRTWTNTHYQEGRTMYLLYLRSGRHYYWQYARDSARHKMDVSTVNYGERPAVGPNQTPYGGYHVYGVFGWSGMQGISCHYQNVDYKAWEYFITGDRRGYDQAQGWAEEMARSCWVSEKTRDALGTLEEALEVYQAVRDPRLLKVIHWFQEASLAAPIAEIALPHYNQMGWYRMHEYTRDPRVKARLLEQWGDGNQKKRYGLGSVITMLMTYRMTGDRRLLAIISKLRPNDNYTPPVVSRQMMNAPYLMSALAELGAGDDLVMTPAIYERFWQSDFEKWRASGQSLFGTEP